MVIGRGGLSSSSWRGTSSAMVIITISGCTSSSRTISSRIVSTISVFDLMTDFDFVVDSGNHLFVVIDLSVANALFDGIGLLREDMNDLSSVIDLSDRIEVQDFVVRYLVSDIDFCRSRVGEGEVRRLREDSVRGVRESIDRRESLFNLELIRRNKLLRWRWWWRYGEFQGRNEWW